MSSPLLLTVVTLAGAALAPVAAIEIDRVRFRHWPWLHPITGLPSFLIMLALLFALATAVRAWEQERVISNAVMPIAGLVWLAWFRWRIDRLRR